MPDNTTLQNAELNIGTPSFESLTPDGATDLLIEIQPSGAWDLETTHLLRNPSVLRVTYDISVAHPDRLFDMLDGITLQHDTVGIGVIWDAPDSLTRGAASLGRIHKPYAGLPWKFRGFVDLPWQDLGSQFQLQVVLYGGRLRITADIEETAQGGPYYGTVLSVLRTDPVSITLVRSKICGGHLQQPAQGFITKNQLQLGSDGPTLALRRVRSGDGPLWRLCYADGSSLLESPPDEEHLWIELNELHPDYRELTGADVSSALIREMSAGILTVLLETVCRLTPYALLDSASSVSESGVRTVRDIIRWMTETYDLADVWEPAEAAARIRKPPSAESSAQVMEWERLTAQKTCERCERWSNMNPKDRSREMSAQAMGLSEPYRVLRERLLEAARAITDAPLSQPKQRKRGVYQFDMEFGLELHRILNDAGFSVRAAADSEVWYYLGISVIPELLYWRFDGLPAKPIHAELRRNYLGRVWWYIHASLQFAPNGVADYSATRLILRHNSTDTIQQLVDRCGGGYPLELYREIMRQHAEWVHDAEHSDRTVLRTVLEANVRLSKWMEPMLYDGGVEGYVRELFTYAFPGSDSGNVDQDDRRMEAWAADQHRPYQTFKSRFIAVGRRLLFGTYDCPVHAVN